MKYRISPKNQGRNRFRPLLETEDKQAVLDWLANPPVPTTTRIYGTDGTYHQLALRNFHELAVYELKPCASRMDDNDDVPMAWVQSHEIETVASMETEEGRTLIARWSGVKS